MRGNPHGAVFVNVAGGHARKGDLCLVDGTGLAAKKLKRAQVSGFLRWLRWPFFGGIQERRSGFSEPSGCRSQEGRGLAAKKRKGLKRTEDPNWRLLDDEEPQIARRDTDIFREDLHVRFRDCEARSLLAGLVSPGSFEPDVVGGRIVHVDAEVGQITEDDLRGGPVRAELFFVLAGPVFPDFVGELRREVQVGAGEIQDERRFSDRRLEREQWVVEIDQLRHSEGANLGDALLFQPLLAACRT